MMKFIDKVYAVYWLEGKTRGYGFVAARTQDEAFRFAAMLLKDTCYITAIYKTSLFQVNEKSVCLNFDAKKVKAAC